MSMTSKERILRTMGGQATDYTPLWQPLYTELLGHCDSYEQFVERQVALGLDVVVAMPDLDLHVDPRVRLEFESEPSQPNPLMHQRYHTPAGTMETIVERTADWPFGDRVPLISDFVIPRGRKFLVTEAKDLEALPFILPEPTAESIAKFREEAEGRRRLAARLGLATCGGFHRLSDMFCWLAGCDAFATLGLTDPEFFESFLKVIARWQDRQLDIILSTKPDVLLDPQWYGTTFLSPQLYDKFLVPQLRHRVDAAHAGGAKVCTIATTTVMPFFGSLKRLGIDMLYGVDPIMGTWDLARAKKELGDTVSLGGGVNGYLTIVDGTPADVERAVEQAMAILAPGGRFVLGAVDNVRIDDHTSESCARTQANMNRMVEVWKRLR